MTQGRLVGAKAVNGCGNAAFAQAPRHQGHGIRPGHGDRLGNLKRQFVGLTGQAQPARAWPSKPGLVILMPLLKHSMP